MCFNIWSMVIEKMYSSNFELYIFFVINLAVVAKEKIRLRKKLEAYKTSTESIDVPNFGTQIIGMEEYAIPILEEKSSLLEECLKKFLTEEQIAVSSAELFHVTIPEENTKNICFFFELKNNKNIAVTFDRTSGSGTAIWCEYTKEEIVSEIWEGICPTDRDVQES